MSESKSPPTPDGVPVLGQGLAFSNDAFGAIERWARLGDVVRLNFPGRTLYMVTAPALIEQVLVEDQDAFTISKVQRETFTGVEDNAVTANTGDRWERLRKSLHPAFTWEGIQSYGVDISNRTAEHLNCWEAGDRFNLVHEMRRLTVRILGDTLLGIDVEGNESVLFEAADALVARSDPRRFGQLLPDWMPTPTDRRFRRAVGAVDEFVESVLTDGDPTDNSVVAVLLDARERGDLTTAEVRDNLTALMLAGHDSTALALSFAWYELSRHPTIRQAISDEVQRVVGDRLPSADDFDQLRRTHEVVNETLRLYPPTWAVNRETTDSVALGEYEIPAGGQVLMPQWVLHRDEQYWESPETFDPSRWNRDADRPEYAYFPFSGGPRHCIGMRFARLELVLALATMARRVDLDVRSSEPLSFMPSLSLRPEQNLAATVHAA
jgi:cytochrome P450